MITRVYLFSLQCHIWWVRISVSSKCLCDFLNLRVSPLSCVVANLLSDVRAVQVLEHVRTLDKSLSEVESEKPGQVPPSWDLVTRWVSIADNVNGGEIHLPLGTD